MANTADQDSVMSIVQQNEEMSERYPSVELESGVSVHIYERDGAWSVWINPEDHDFSGMCLAHEPTKHGAIEAAVRVIEEIEAFLQGPPQGEGIWR